MGLEQSVEFVGQSAFLNQSDAFVFDFAIFDEQHGGNVADAVSGGDGGALLHVGGADDGSVGVFGGDFIDDGGQGFAGAAPGGTEIDHHGFVGFDEFIKGFFCNCCAHNYFNVIVNYKYAEG